MFMDTNQGGTSIEESCTLDRLALGTPARIERVGLANDDGVRLMEMGLIPGTAVEVARIAPLGDPIDVVVRGYHLSLRKAEAREVTVSPSHGGDGLR